MVQSSRRVLWSLKRTYSHSPNYLVQFGVCKCTSCGQRRLSVFVLLALVAFCRRPGKYGSWYASAAPVCQVQITEIDHPATVQVNQPLPISTHLTITCSPVNKYVVARVDVISNRDERIITSNSTGIGVIRVSNAPYTKTVNVTVFNAVRAPSEAVNWKLQIHAWVFTGENVTANVSQLIQVQVVKPPATPTTSTELIQSAFPQPLQPCRQTLGLVVRGPVVLPDNSSEAEEAEIGNR